MPPEFKIPTKWKDIEKGAQRAIKGAQGPANDPLPKSLPEKTKKPPRHPHIQGA